LFKYSFFLGFILWSPLSAQVNPQKLVIDSLLRVANSSSGIEKVTAYDKISRKYWNINPDSSVHYATLALTEAQKDKSDICFGEAYNSLGNAYSSKGDNETALKYYYKSKEYREQANDLVKVAFSLTTSL
jgi:hypothetical protein